MLEFWHSLKSSEMKLMMEVKKKVLVINHHSADMRPAGARRKLLGLLGFVAFCLRFWHLMISLRSFDTHLHLFPALKSALSGRHFQSNEEVQRAVKNFLRSLGTNFERDGFLKLISRYDKCINVSGKYMGK
ncbi:hypothetical protein AVEN_244527-1 [Araneus ventricosus]|uniref:Histone-lysine N-methyltransferase SETMAR n=1 Tax=Araneus ventricosus TaxID=182803 RepID=A0A4Y2F2K9_ARAVE|nr:hypothetical protein AVEN_244527-1 [Araneus ventricosus]